jgi:phage gpG-like protein
MSVFGFDIRYTVGGQPDDGLRKLSVAFERAGTEFTHFGRYLFPKLGEALETEVGGQFDARGHGPSGSWAQLTRHYAKYKQKRYPGKGILEASGKLRAALTGPSSYAQRSYSDNEFSFGTRGIEYASFHQTGTYRMPARPPIDLTAAFEKEAQAAGLEAAREIVRLQPELGELSD